MTLRVLAGFARCPCCRYLQALVILDQSFRNNAERSDLAPEFSTFTLQSSLHGFVNPWLFRKELKGNENATRTIQGIRVQFFTWPQPFCSPGPSCARQLPKSHTCPLPSPKRACLAAVSALLVSVQHTEPWAPISAELSRQLILLIFTNHNKQSLSHKSREVKAWAFVSAASQPFFTFIPIVFSEEPPSWLPAWRRQPTKLFYKSEWHVHKGD